MTHEIKYKEPTEEQKELMQEFSAVCSKGIHIIMKCEADNALMNASSRLQEAMMWFNSYIINGGKILKDGTEH
jgi:hypothetical protein